MTLQRVQYSAEHSFLLISLSEGGGDDSVFKQKGKEGLGRVKVS